MPLRTTAAIPIRAMPAPTAPHGAALELPLTGAANLDGPPLQSNNPLPINPVVQKESQWCWAACVEMVTGFLNNPKSQCQALDFFPFVTGAKPTVNPCQDSNPFREIGCEIPQMSQVWTSLQVNSVLVPKPANPSQPALQFDDLVAEITNGRPIEVGIAWHGGRGGHAMLVKGHGEINGKRSVWINDPLGATTKFGPNVKGGEGQILFKDLREGNGFGKWVCSWIKLSVNPPAPQG